MISPAGAVNFSWRVLTFLRRASCATARHSFLHLLIVAMITVVVEIGLRLSDVPRLAALLGVRLDRDGEATVSPDSQSPRLPHWVSLRYAEVAFVLRHWPFGDTCLRRALVLGQRLRRLEPILVIGVRHDEASQLAAHAWLVVRGVTLDPLAAQYAPLRHLSQR